MTFQLETNFNTKNVYQLKTIPLKDKVDVSAFIGAEDMSIYAFENKTIISGDFTKEETSKNYGIANADFISAIKKHPHLYQKLVKSNSNSNTDPIYLMKKEFKYYYKEYGLYGNLSDLTSKPKKEMDEFTSKNQYQDCDNSQYEFLQFVKNENHLRVWRDSKNELYIEPFVLNYIGANLDNGTYHLEELIEHLMQRDDVSFITNSERNYANNSKLLKCPLVGNEDGIDRIIADIPGYNSEEGRDETICVVYYPNTEAIDKLMNWKSDTNQKIWNIENYIVRVLLDGDKFSKQPAIVEEPVVPKRKFKS